jgi:hypothetical protein
MLLLIEKGTNIKRGCRRYCKCDQDLEQLNDKNEWDNENKKRLPITSEWDDDQTISTVSTS